MQNANTVNEANISAFGFSDIATYVAHVERSMTYKCTGASMVVAGLLSDAQELLAMEDNERARQTLNVAKHLLFLVMDGKLIGTVERK